MFSLHHVDLGGFVDLGRFVDEWMNWMDACIDWLVSLIGLFID